jgi:L-amino acid N-acyltransferase YncA
MRRSQDALTYTLEPMTAAHRTAIIDIYNHYVENSFAAFPDALVGYDMFDRFLAMTAGYPALVAKTDGGEVIAFAFLRAYHPADAFKRTAEISCFVRPPHVRRGLGTLLLDRLIDGAKTIGVDNLLASISSLNDESVSFHRRCGFVECGRLPTVGRKRGRSFDVVWMQRRLETDGRARSA